MVIFTGNESKLMLNNKLRGFKRSNVDLTVDKALYIIFTVQAALCVFGVIAHYIWLHENANHQWYQYVKKNGKNVSHFGDVALLNYFTFLVLLDVFVPISLYVSMELVKFSQAWLINQDKDMKCKADSGEDVYAQARTSNLNEELGQVSFIFSDKTGTLTQNKMEFIRCHIGGVRYGPGEMEKQHDFVERVPAPKGLPPFDEVTCRFTNFFFIIIAKKKKGEGEEEKRKKVKFFFFKRKKKKENRNIYNRLARRHDNPIVNDFLTCMAACHSIIPEYPDEDEEKEEEAAVASKGKGKSNQTNKEEEEEEEEEEEKKEKVKSTEAKEDKTKDVDYSKIVYQAASPDEKALVLFARNMHYVFYDSHVQNLEVKHPKTKEVRQVDGEMFYVNIFGEEVAFEMYHFLEFSSARKRMSVILKDPRDGKFKLYSKGADNVIFQRLREDQKKTVWPDLLQSLAVFAADGLRTLVCGVRILNDDEYWTWLQKLNKARAAMENRDELVDACFDEIEQQLTLLGATAIEDRLQDQVPDTIATLAVAGISIWVLTGDKVETAINIGRSCKLLTSTMNEKDKTLYVIDPDEQLPDEEAKRISEQAFDDAWAFLKDTPENNPNQGLVISGKALGYVFPHRKRDAQGKEIPPTEEQMLEEARMQEKVLKICKKCRAVVCCRVSPKQKSQMVQLVKHNVQGTITLAIGDGANDVPMIKAAHVGVGISGQEGLQAVMASDYAIAQFRFLQDLLLIHGAWDYRRISVLILYSFYKNICFSMTQIWFSFFSGYTGSLFYDAFSGSCFNLVFTALPVLFAATLDRPYSKEIARFCPELYENGPSNGSFSLRIFSVYVLEGVINSMVIFFGTIFFIDSQTHSDGKVGGYWISATTMFTSLVTVATVKMMIETKTWTSWTVLVFFLSLLLWFVFAIVWSAIPPSLGWGNNDIYQVAQHAFKMPVFWFIIMFAVSLCVVPEVLYRYIRRMYFPTRLHVIQELESYPDLRTKFLNEIKSHLQQQESVTKGGEEVKSRERYVLMREYIHIYVYMYIDMGFAEFQVDKNHPDYVMSQSTYMKAVSSGRRKGFRKLFGRKDKKPKTEQ
ncbi:hypothetical protein RFI_00007 [Reticulomyxa filosa]|uniref:P-type ATPase C-terminal domain-containing protein n=1 Tax=Reticulomyxa filosa TaxID=46433 RepID=X6PG98_RETFI|nr:hypothetical protein RFI_00007 [Reticulomyxa filosa]|eukprot:ETO37054.1 hypothetical protein RFI_00007 [Reticulomyxa filosa]